MSQATENVRVAPVQVGKYLAQITIIFAAYFVAGKLGQATSNIRSSNLGPVWPAYGVALAAILLCGYRVWVGIAVAAFLIAFLSPVPLVAAVGQAAGATLAALVGAFLLLRIAKFRPSLSRLRDALALVVLGGLGSAMLSATIGVSVLYATHVQAYSGLSSAWLIYWLGDSTGVLLVAPLVLTAPDLLRIRPRARIGEFVGLLLLLIATCFIVFGDLPLIPVKLHVLAFAVLPFVMWAAIRFGVSGAALSILFVATVATVETALGSGPFALNATFTNAVLLDVFFAVLSVSGLTLAAVIAEREHSEREREQLVRKQAAMEARLRLATIVESSDDAIIGEGIDGIVTDWNKGAEYLYGYPSGEIVGKPISFLIPTDRSNDSPEIMKKLNDREAVKHYETVRQKKDGTLLEVSLTVSPIFDNEGRMIGVSTIARDITERKRAEEALRESEERLRLTQAAVHVGVFEWDIKKNENHWSPEMERIYGLAPGSFGGTYEAWIERIHPEDRMQFKWDDQRHVQGGNFFDSEFRVVTPSGETRWLYSRVTLSCDSAGRPVRMLGFAIDITERKAAEVALASISRRLIEAQEQERTRIARELHDDIGQRLALLIIELEQLRQNASDLPVEVRSCIGALQKQTAEIATDVQSMSHELHSSKLEYLGLAVAMRAFCKEFSDQQNVEVVFAQDKVPSTLPQNISLCLFRVLQEALQNAVKHSGVRHFDVELRDTSNELQLTVRDLGSGFDVGQAMKSRGLGLISMAERVKLVEGRLSIDSQPQRGTTIRASVPLNKVARASA